MSCQQASKLITTATTTTAKSIPTKRTVTTTIAAAATVATAAGGAQTPPVAKSSTATAKITKTTPTASKVDVVDVENIGVAATTKTNTFEDPYVFTETITATPPILFNAQKSRARLSEAQHSKNTNNKNNNNKQQRAGKKSSIAASAASHIAQLNGTTTTAALAKAQASLGAAVASAAATTNFNNVTQSQRQPASQQQLQLQSPLQLQSQASPKRATNVCVVRPQQQQQQKQQQQQQQQQLKQQQQAKLITKNGAPQPPPPPPPLYPHTPSLWQTPLILDTTQKQQQTNIVVATALVSPPTSPASLPSPTASNSAATPTAAVTAMVSPIVSPPKGGGSLPPSKFHHTTLAQHFAKVECLKKKKSLPLACQSSNNNNNNTIVAQTQVSRGAYHLTHPPPLTVFNTTTTATTPAAAAAMKKHSADAAIDDSNDLNEIPVNVIFRKPPELLSGQTPPRSSVDAKLALLKLGAVAPLSPPMPLAAAANAVCPRLPAATVTSINNAPALITQEAALGAAASVPAVAAAPIASIQNDQMSSKVANSAVTLAAAAVPKRKSTAAAGSTSSRKGNKQIAKNSAQEAPPPSLPLAQVAVSSSLPPTPPQSEAPPTRRRKATAPASKRTAALLITENEPLENDVPYGLQKHWLPADASRQLGLDQPAAAANIRDREERIAMRKGLLRHQALQLLSTRKLQEAPLTAARQRLQSVQSLLLKYQDTASQQQGIGVGNRCLVAECKEPTLSMAAHCERHIVQNTTQQLFQPCVAWRVDGTACQAPVFDVLHTLALCPVHSHLRAGLELQQPRKQQLTSKTAPTPAVPGPVPAIAGAVIMPAVVNKRKRKPNPNANPVGRPQKRAKKPDAAITPTITTTLPSRPPMSAVMQRKSSTTSLESIASNSQSSAMSHSALPPYTPTAPVMSSAMPQLSIVPPALAPLSDYQLQQQLLQPKIEPEQQLDLLANFKADEISQIVAQLAAASSELHHNNNSLHYNNNNNNNTYSSNNNSNSGSSSISCGFPSFNAAFGNAMSGQQQPPPQQQPQQQQIGGQLTCNNNNNNTTLDSTQSLLSQHMFGICENSSAYASSEDTGLGGLSESELIGANDADDIALNGAHLLEEHDLVNVFDTFLDDAFNELFQSAQQADCDAAERALENADKSLKCLQPTIGSTDHDSAFLNDLLDVGDDLLVNAVTSVMNSPSTSGIGIDAGTLFVDSSGGGNSTSSNGAIGSLSSPAASVADIRGLVQT